MAHKESATETLPMPVELVGRKIYSIRGQRVMLDSDLAQLYQVDTKALNRAVKRNADVVLRLNRGFRSGRQSYCI